MSTNCETGFSVADALRVGHARMDQEHQELAVLIKRLCSAPDGMLVEALDTLIAHAKAHFAEEDRQMCALEFPARECHMREHSAVLMSAEGVRKRLRAGEVGVTRRFAAELDAWFTPHVVHLDSALAHWISKHAWGSQPLVFRRRSASAEVLASV